MAMEAQLLVRVTLLATYRVLVSCASSRTTFQKCIRKICRESHGELGYRFIPTKIVSTGESNIVDRMLEEVRNADLILMDVTPTVYRKRKHSIYITNQGVLIEYGTIISNEVYSLKLGLYCVEGLRDNLHPYFLKPVQGYTIATAMDSSDPTSLTSQVEKQIRRFKKELPGRHRAISEQYAGLKKYMNSR
jgi:hypothetical protein